MTFKIAIKDSDIKLDIKADSYEEAFKKFKQKYPNKTMRSINKGKK